MVRLPVGGAPLWLRPPTGADDMLLLEGGDEPAGLAIALLERLAMPEGGKSLDIGALVLTDYQALLLRLHQAVFGDRIEAVAMCARSGCHAALAVSFDVDAYVAHRRPRIAAGVAPDETCGWWRLTGTKARFRLPTAADLAASRREAEPEAALRRRCLDPDGMAAPLRRRAERAMALQAPDLSQAVEAVCPECGAAVEMLFDVEHFVLRALRAHAAFVYEDVHLLALHYHWPEETILAMPQARRSRYAEMLRGAA
jgi:hypothetical protein